MNAYDGICLLAEICLLLLKIIFGVFESLYRLIVPIEEKNVAGEIVLITGAGHGIGRELALKYSSLGAIIVCWDLNSNGNEQTVNEIKKLYNVQAHAFQCDVSNRDDVFKIAKKVISDVGHPTIVVNNAGIMPCQSFNDYTEDTIRKIFDVNVFGNIWVLQAFLPNMIANNYGHVVAMSSLAGIIGIKNVVPYCASKFAVRGLMEALRDEYDTYNKYEKNNVQFTTIYPYMVDTGLCKKPRIRFPSIMALVSPRETAAQIVSAQRRNCIEVTIPRYWLFITTTLSNFSNTTIRYFKEFLNSGVDTD